MALDWGLIVTWQTRQYYNTSTTLIHFDPNAVMKPTLEHPRKFKLVRPAKAVKLLSQESSMERCPDSERLSKCGMQARTAKSPGKRESRGWRLRSKCLSFGKLRSHGRGLAFGAEILLM